MNFAKTIFAVFASVLLVGTQTVSATGKTASGKSQICGCCACKKMDCCVAQPTSVPQPIPTNPARAESQNNFQIIAAIVSLLQETNETPAQKISFPQSASLIAISVPLYEWNCSYLI
jgi:hypothetical protein